VTDTYRDPCPKCGTRLVAVSKDEYVQHLRNNDETLVASIEERLVVERSEVMGNDG
jgi:transcription initiation factor IIE alpha subunit